MTYEMQNLWDQTEEICRRLGLEPSLVAEVVLRPGSADVTLYQLNEHGSKFVDPETGRAATETREYLITTNRGAEE